MPLLKKTPFSLLEPPEDLESHERVFQVRFTKEIFRNYEAYLNRINLYRQRVWTCKISGKINLTYEEALVSERNAIEKVQEIPKEFVEPALHIIQFSMLSLKDLADAVIVKLQDHFTVGADLDGRKDGTTCPCKLLKVLLEKTAKPQYEVAWLDKNKKVIETAVVNGEDLSWRKFPLSRGIMKSFIRESTYRSAPWVLHDKLAEKYRISKDPPKELKDKIIMQNGLVVCNNKRKKETEEESGGHKRKNVENGKLESEEDDKLQREAIKYPIEDTLVQPGADDPLFSERPIPSRDFNVPMECVGDLLMVWDFCSSFGRFLHLSPFSLEDFENAICHKDSNLILIVEVHSALLQILIKDNGGHFFSVKEKSQKLKKISLVTWTEYICDFLKTIDISDSSNCISMIKRGHYGLLGAQAKLEILQELVNQALETGLLREKLDEFIEQITELNATKRIEALEEAKKKREEKGQLKTDSFANGDINGHHIENAGKGDSRSPDNLSSQNGVLAGEMEGETVSSQHKITDEISGSNLSAKSSKGKKQSVDGAEKPGNTIRLSRKEVPKLKEKKTTETMSKERRKDYFEREMEKRFLRSNSLGKDRDHNRYWWFKRDARIFVESSNSKLWGYYSSKEEVDSLIGSLNCKGVRERALHRQLNQLYSRISLELDKRSKNLANKIAMDEAVLRRSTRVQAMPREMTANSFLRYVNKWKED